MNNNKSQNIIVSILKNNLKPLDEYIFGTADLNGLLANGSDEYQFGISIGKKLDDKIIDSICNGPTSEYQQHYNLINDQLIQVARNIKKELKNVKIDSIVVEPTISKNPEELNKYFKTLTADVSHKMVATRAGLGWIGKTDLFISNDFGPRLRLISLLINQKPEQISAPVEKSKCGKCKVCVIKCPAQAANGLLWDIHTHRDKFFDAQKCKQKCSELSKQRLKKDQLLCALCVSVCPMGKKKKATLSNI